MRPDARISFDRITIGESRSGDVPYVLTSYGADNAPSGEGENADITSEDP